MCYLYGIPPNLKRIGYPAYFYMKLIKTVKQIGNSLGNIFSKEECKTMGIEIGDFIDLTNVQVIKQKKEDKA